MISETLGHYEIIEPLGAGGMGEVYRAHDTTLKRDVAIKVLPENLSADVERLARLEREAQLLAALNHPNIAVIHGLEEADGVRFMVLELIEGESLAEMLSRGRIQVDKALGIARQIAEALEAAHAKGIIHRDLKPGNVVITPEGRAKVLDFGLAKSDGAGGSSQEVSPDITESPTVAAATQAGTILGTAAYMSPEQARGKPLDKRTDIWSFGCVLYEMLTGKKAFERETLSDVLAAILERDPDWSAMSGDVPPLIQVFLHRCLRKDPDRRLHDIADARIEIEEAGEPVVELGTGTGAAGVASPAVGWTRTTRAAAVTIAAIAGAAATVVLYILSPGSEAPLIQSSLVLPPGVQGNFEQGIVLSPDGATVAFVGSEVGGRDHLWVRDLASTGIRKLPGTEGAYYPFWSPDSRSLGFFAGGTMKTVPIDGGAVETLAAVPYARGGSWSPAGFIVFAPDSVGGLASVSVTGGEPEVLTTLDEARGETSHRFPFFLPDGRSVLFLAQTAQGYEANDESRIEVLDLETGERTPLTSANSSVVYSSSGHILYWREGGLVAHPFDPDQRTLTADSIPLAENVRYTPNEYGVFSSGGEGMLVYEAASPGPLSQLAVVTPDGQVIGTPSQEATYQDLALSHAGGRVAYRVREAIWVLDMARGTANRLTFDGDNWAPVWSPDDRWIAYNTDRNNRHEIMRRLSSGAGGEELVGETEHSSRLHDWSPVGKSILLEYRHPDTDMDIARFDLETGTYDFLVQTPFADAGPSYSPDGEWVVYHSSETGTGRWEIFAVPARGGSAKYQITSSGGIHPDWSPGGESIYYFGLDGQVMIVGVQVGQSLEYNLPEALLALDHPADDQAPFHVMPDGKSFLLNRLIRAPEAVPLTLVQGWTRLSGER